jgi:ferritin
VPVVVPTGYQALLRDTRAKVPDGSHPPDRPSRVRRDVEGKIQDVMNIRVVEAINEQINSELSASYSYLAMSAWCERERFTGAARWLRLQSQEEYMHAMKLFDFILARDEQVVLKPLEHPRQTFGSLLEVFERALTQEQEVSRQIDSLYETAFHEKAFAAVAELQWFLTEQVEEEKTGREIVGKLRMIGDDAASILDIDRELGSRTVVETSKTSAA